MLTSGHYIAGIRKGLGLIKTEFAQIIYMSSQTICDWEQGNRLPSGPAKALLKILYLDIAR